MIIMTLDLWDESIVFAIALFIGYALHPVINSIIVYLVSTILNGMNKVNKNIRKNIRKNIKDV